MEQSCYVDEAPQQPVAGYLGSPLLLAIATSIPPEIIVPVARSLSTVLALA